MRWLLRAAKIENVSDNNLLEKLAEIEHEQWMAWSKSVAPEVSKGRKDRWRKLWVPYSKLSDEMKEEDRKYARKVLKIINSNEN
jgi:hypothetical protein